MKKILVCLAGVAGLLLSSSFVSAQVVVTTSVIGEITTTFTSLFAALRDGDVQTIKLYLSDQEYRRHKVLFEQNSEYPAFLRNFYRGATVRIGDIHSVHNASDDVVAEFIVEFPGGETINTGMRLTRDAGGRWIVKKYLAGKHDQGESFGASRR
jgi:hypothetical protein